ncbi:MAG: T9SS type A sorting domain-containing protein [Bacteroidetes bacterium]|nr:T9SS type A sorting domain-containing protein [Bacteroidota bacterium]
MLTGITLFGQVNRHYETNPNRLRTNQWIFGNNNLIKFYPNNQADTFKINYSGASTVFSTEDGRVVLYTDGSNVWDSLNNNVVTGLNKGGFIKSIVFYYYEPDSVLYLFSSSGTYTVFQISYTGIIVKEKNVSFDVESNIQTLALINSQDGNGAWLVTSVNDINQINKLFSYRIINGKLNKCPVETILGTSLEWMDLTFSNNGKYLLITEIQSPSNQPGIVCSFNIENGKANILFLLTNLKSGSVAGAAFSPNDRILYIHQIQKPMKVIQFFPDDASKTINSTKLAPMPSGLFKLRNSIIGDIVYTSYDSNYIGAIKNPNDFNGFTLKAQGIKTRDSGSRFAIPYFNQSYFYTPSIDFTYIYNCIINSIEFEGRDTFFATVHSWQIQKSGKPVEGTYSTKKFIHQFSDTGTYTIYYIASSGNRSDTISKSITIYPKINKDFLGKDTSFEVGIGFNKTLNAPVGMHCYFWYNDSSGASFFNTDTIGTFICRISSQSFCEVTDTIKISNCINNLPLPTLSRSRDTLYVNQTTADSFIWYKDNIIYTITKTPFITINSFGNYRVEVAKKGFCSKFSEAFLVMNLAINSPFLYDKHIKVYPNPTCDFINIEFEEPNYYKIRVYNSIGMLVNEIETNSNTTIDLSIFPSGVYLIHFTNAENIQFNIRIFKD